MKLQLAAAGLQLAASPLAEGRELKLQLAAAGLLRPRRPSRRGVN